MKRLTKCLEGMGIDKDDNVLIQLWGKEIDLVYLNEFENKAKKMSDNITVYHHSKKHYAEKFCCDNSVNNIDMAVFENNDIVIDLMAESIMPSKEFTEIAVGNYRVFMGEIFKRLMQAKTFVQLRLPTSEMAISFGLDEKLYVEVLNKGLNVDYDEIKSAGEGLINKFLDSKEFILVTGKEKLVLRVDNRPWHNDCGNGDLPCGEVYTPCIENSANGSLLIEKTNLFGKVFNDIILTFEDGLLIKSSDATFLASFEEMNEDSRRIGELGFGTNTGLSELINCPVLDEKVKGTVHVALGRNNMFGGKNEGDIHHDLVFRPTHISFDGKIYRNF